MLMFVLFVTFSFLANLSPSEAACDRNTGPSGLTECVLLTPYYSKKQWSTCLTDTYIKQKSGGKHRCRDRSRTYCWYQCMLETHNLERGPVYTDCGCSAGQTTPNPGDTSTLPQWCFSPSGADCSWYHQCLETRHPCEQSSTAYALTFAEKFCTLYTQSLSSFTSLGQRWIDAVRKCLQVALVPLLRPWMSPSCADIRKTAFDSHTGCYLRPYSGAPSVCDLPWTDWWRMFWTIKGAFKDAFLESLHGMIQTTVNCPKKLGQIGGTILAIHPGIRFGRIVFTLFRKGTRFGRSVNNDEHIYAGEVLDGIAKYLGWSSKGITWFAFVANTTSGPGSDRKAISIILGDKFTYNIDISGRGLVNLNTTVQELADAIRNGKLDFKIRGGSDRVYVNDLEATEDLEGKKVYMKVTAPPAKSTGDCLMAARLLLFCAVFMTVFG